MRARIRDFFVTFDNWIFAVADYHHASGVRSMLRYVPDLSGDRIANGVRYKSSISMMLSRFFEERGQIISRIYMSFRWMMYQGSTLP